MAKLYPPNIEGTIPAFCGTTIVVPFSLNRAVSKSQIAGFALKIKTVQGSTLLGTVKQYNSDLFDLDSFMEVQFDIEGIFTPKLGQYYKLQLAFIGSDHEVGYYSTVGVIKYTSEPKLEISGLLLGSINNHSYYYTGVYSQEKQDTTEKLYSSRFKLFDSKGSLIKDSGEILHNVTEDDNAYEAHEDFVVSMDLEENASYYLQYFVTTSNGWTGKTGRYRIMQKKSVTPELKASLSAFLNYDEGYIDLYLVGQKDEYGIEEVAIGSFVVCRAASNENNIWNKVCEFSLQSQTPTRFLWRDYTIEQGVSYQYSVQQYNDYGLYSDRIVSPIIKADFEDAFLYDGKRQLKIRYNPKVSSFKTDVLESKTDTIGSKHPFIFRNGNVYYKEFPISGLISYQMDENQMFNSWSALGIAERTIDFTSENLMAERLFKLDVLAWLNNGEPKLFRSPTEGNYIVRLLNVSLSPTDTLGRMLHTFSSTAYEIADFSYDSLLGYNFIDIEEISTIQTRWSTVSIAGHSSELNDLVKNIRRYYEAGVSTVFSEEMYNRILSYDMNLSNAFTEQLSVSSYVLSSDVTESILLVIGKILNLTATSTRSYSPAEYAKVVKAKEDLKDYFVPKTSAVIYTLKQDGTNMEGFLTELESMENAVTYVTGKVNTRPAYSIYAYDMLPGTIIELRTKRAGMADAVEEIQIGATGSYRASFENPITAIVIPQKIIDNKVVVNGLQGSITYSYESTATNVFDLIRNLEVIDIPIQQWIGQQSKTYYDTDIKDYVTVTDLIQIIENNKITIADIFYLRFQKRELQKIFINALAIPDNEATGVKLSDLPNGISLVPVEFSSEKTYQPNKYYYQFTRTTTTPNANDPLNPIVTIIPYYALDRAVNPTADRTYYEKVYTYFTNMDCTQELDLDNLDPYYVYQICNGRFDYTYQDVWYEKDYIDSNFAHGYYVDKNGVKYPVLTDMYLDGLSTSENIITYNADTYSNVISINGDEMDLTETGKFELVGFDDPITSISFDNGIICDMSYQIRELTYNLEETDETVHAYKATYESYKNKLYGLRMVASIDADWGIQRAQLFADGYGENSVEYQTAEMEYRKVKNECIVMMGGPSVYALIDTSKPGITYDIATQNYEILEKEFLAGIKTSYAEFIHQLNLALAYYQEANDLA